MATTPNTNVSIVDYLNSTGKASDYNTRAKMATEYGITGYKGTAEQNTQLLGKLKGGSTTPATPTAVVPVPTGQVTNPNQYINQNQNQDFATASKVNDVPVRSSPSSTTDLMSQAKELITGNLGQKPDFNAESKAMNLRTQYGITDGENQMTELQAQARDIQAQKQARINSEKGKPVAMNVISGRVSEVEQQENERLTAINNSIQTLQSQLNTKYNVVDSIMKYASMDYDNAVKDYDTKFSQNMAIFDMVRDISKEEKSDIERQEDSARANAQIMISSMQANGTTFQTLSPEEQTNLTKMGVQSGLGANFFKDVMKVSAGKEILTTITNDDKTKATIMYKDGTTKVISTGLPAGSGVQPKTTTTGGGKTYTSGNLKYTDSTVGTLSTVLKQASGADNYTDPNVYYNAYQSWIKDGGLTQDFIKQFPPKIYVNPANKALPTFLQSGTQKSSGSTERTFAN
jgi:hypothetical protein